MRETVVLSTTHMAQLKKLTAEQRGDLMLAIMSYQTGEDIPEMDILTELVFDFFKEDIDAHNAKYDERKAKFSESGKKGGRPKKEAAEEEKGGFSEESEASNENQEVSEKRVAFSEKGGFLKKANLTELNLTELNNKKEKDKKEKRPSVFKPPTVNEVASLIKERGYHFDAEQFVAYYQANGWKVGKSSMKDWKAACVTWEKRWENSQDTRTRPTTSFDSYDQRDYDFDKLERDWIAGRRAT